MIDQDRYRWLQDDSPLDDIYCLSFHRATPAEVVRRFCADGVAGREMTFEEYGEQVDDFINQTDGGDGGGYVAVKSVGAWSVAIEACGWYAALVEWLPRLSRGSEVVAISRHDYAEDGFGYAVDGQIITTFTPNRPQDVWGADVERLRPLMRELRLPPEGLDPEAAWEELCRDGLLRVFALAERITGVPVTPDLLEGPFLVREIDQEWRAGENPVALP